MDREMSIETDIDFDIDFDDSAARRIARYVHDVVTSLGLRGDSSCVEVDPRPAAYVALDGRMPDFPDHDVALLWKEGTGWSAAVEDRIGQLVEVARLGGDPMPMPVVVARWVGALLRTDFAREPSNCDFAAFVPAPRGAVLS
ncbi:hypothetical protein SAMN05421507_103249 [Lentzea jiangxiensis]|uniref:DUF6292 domain-containing protein n=2 Tax=Lentzea jiangxiensis TaxID=641025 RepID=A0A1H0LB35_9PSEU|nr:hypothetical protein SAMN05421507_103249 [Lentzea jiangxiensis]